MSERTFAVSQNATLHVKKREVRGTKACRRLRAAGEVPAIVYGHKAEPVAIQVPQEELETALRHHSRMFDIRLGRKKETVLLREVQHDAMGDEIVHADFVRVAMDEAVKVDVPVVLKGVPKAEHAVLQQTLDEVEVECLPADIPEEILVPVAEVEVGQSLHVADITPPPGVKILTDPETVVVTLTAAAAEAVEAAAEAPEAAAAEEPEVIGRGEKEKEKAAEEPSETKAEKKGDKKGEKKGEK